MNDPVWRVFKYDIPLEDGPVSIEMPPKSEILHVALQAFQPMIWAKVNTNADVGDLQDYWFYWRCTGHEMKEAADMPYIGTIHVNANSSAELVFHLFGGITVKP